VIPEIRFVLYQGNPESKFVELFTSTGPDLIDSGTPLTLYAQLPGSTAIAFTIACTHTLNLLSIPFATAELATAGAYNYSIYAEPVDGDRALKLRGVVRNGTGIEIVPVPVSAPVA
jgi:hypothetical protein